MDGKRPKGFGQFDRLMKKLVNVPAEALPPMTPKERNAIAGEIAGSIGAALGQEYRKVGDDWWLFTAGKAMRPLKLDEVEWHVARRHAPFVEGGLTPNDPHWWDDPE